MGCQRREGLGNLRYIYNTIIMQLFCKKLLQAVDGDMREQLRHEVEEEEVNY